MTLPDTDTRHRIRRQAGLTLKQAAGILGVSVRTLERWEWGDCEPSIANYGKYARQLEKWAAS